MGRADDGKPRGMTDCWPEPAHYEYAVVYRLPNAPATIENWGTDMKSCLAAYNAAYNAMHSSIYTGVGIQMRSVTGWSDVDPEKLAV